MGWTYTYKQKGKRTLLFFQERFFQNRLVMGEVIDCAVVKLREAYMVYEMWHMEEDGTWTPERVALVCMLDYKPNDPWYNFGYKDMDETMLPYLYNCPEKILVQLTPTTNENAIQWRNCCWENIKNRQKKVKLKRGMIIEFESPIRFSGFELKRFRCVNPRKSWFTFENDKTNTPRYVIREGTRAQIPHWEVQYDTATTNG